VKSRVSPAELRRAQLDGLSQLNQSLSNDFP
jgi:hypothetical protein